MSLTEGITTILFTTIATAVIGLSSYTILQDNREDFFKSVPKQDAKVLRRYDLNGNGILERDELSSLLQDFYNHL